jgi:hypothetical protein
MQISSFEQIEKLFTSLFQQTIALLESEDFESYDARTKLLSFISYFEMLTANRSFTVALLKEDKTN